MYIPVILGTAREGRNSEKVAKFVLQEAKKAKLKSEIIDVKDFIMGFTDNTETSQKAKKLAQKIKKADAIIIVTPEYNHGYPGELKLMLDMLYQQYAKKPVGICGVSSGSLGGARAVEQLRLVCIEFRMLPIREALYFPSVQNLFDNKGVIKEEVYYKRSKKFFDELIGYAKALNKA